VTGIDRPAIRCRHLRTGNHNADKPVAGLSRKLAVSCDHHYVFWKAPVCRGKRASGLNGVTLVRVKQEQSDA